MNKDILIFELSQAAWAHFIKEWKSWALLIAGCITFIILAAMACFYLPEYISALLLGFLGAIYAAILHQNGLDAAYGRKLSMIKITPTILFASLFFIAISLFRPFPEYSEFLLLVLPADFQFLTAINWMLHIIISYILVRCMFVGMIILEEKCDVIKAFRKSFKLTAHHRFFLLLGFAVAFAPSILAQAVHFFLLQHILITPHISLAVAFGLSALTIFGYFMVLPYTILMKSLLFKQLNLMVK